MAANLALLLLLGALLSCASAFRPQSARATPFRARTDLNMGGKMSKFGIFSPAVYAAKFALGIHLLIECSIVAIAVVTESKQERRS